MRSEPALSDDDAHHGQPDEDDQAAGPHRTVRARLSLRQTPEYHSCEGQTDDEEPDAHARGARIFSIHAPRRRLASRQSSQDTTSMKPKNASRAPELKTSR
ncbi:hypothetical protein BJF82_13640 [Kytococcus sp. CUA-901]|nr:hypothetical protein BJF82_13640 [Kytococcus sp. CUA-901]